MSGRRLSQSRLPDIAAPCPSSEAEGSGVAGGGERSEPSPHLTNYLGETEGAECFAFCLALFTCY